MPARKRHKKEPEHPDPLVRFGRALKAREAKEEADAARRKAEADEAHRQAVLAAAHAAAVRNADEQLARAIAAVKRARAERRGVDEADTAYREAKARVVELETGVVPTWAPRVDGPPDPGDGAGDDPGQNPGDGAGHERNETA